MASFSSKTNVKIGPQRRIKVDLNETTLEKQKQKLEKPR